MFTSPHDLGLHITVIHAPSALRATGTRGGMTVYDDTVRALKWPGIDIIMTQTRFAAALCHLYIVVWRCIAKGSD